MAGSAGDFRRCCSCCAGPLAVAVPLVPLPPSANRDALLGRGRRHARGRARHLAAALGPVAAVFHPRAHSADAVPDRHLQLLRRRRRLSLRDVLLHHVRMDRDGSPERHVGEGAAAAAVAYLLPLAIGDHWNSISAWSAVYVLPAGILLGEATAWVSDRLGRTQPGCAIRKRASASSSWRTRSRCGSSTWKTCDSSR